VFGFINKKEFLKALGWEEWRDELYRKRLQKAARAIVKAQFAIGEDLPETKHPVLTIFGWGLCVGYLVRVQDMWICTRCGARLKAEQCESCSLATFMAKLESLIDM
jgi:hypothetical protein